MTVNEEAIGYADLPNKRSNRLKTGESNPPVFFIEPDHNLYYTQFALRDFMRRGKAPKITTPYSSRRRLVSVQDVERIKW